MHPTEAAALAVTDVMDEDDVHRVQSQAWRLDGEGETAVSNG
jgi:hypothetical protein